MGLDIETMNVSKFVEYTDFNAPITADSNITTYVDVVDGEQIVIGGMMRSETKQVTHQIPILGSIPFTAKRIKSSGRSSMMSLAVVVESPPIYPLWR